MTVRAIIIDDDRLARKELRSLLTEFEQISIVGEAEDLTTAIELIKRNNPDVVFLDIQLSNENGFDLLKHVAIDFKLIFVTAFDQYAIRAFEINALDYLLKPVNPKRLATAIERLFEDETLDVQPELRPLEMDDRLLLDINGRSLFLKVSEISHIAASGDYTGVYISIGRKVMLEKPLWEWEDRLPEKHFVRIPRSMIININKIEKIESLFNRTMEVKLKDFPVPCLVSRRYATRLKEKLG